MATVDLKLNNTGHQAGTPLPVGEVDDGWTAVLGPANFIEQPSYTRGFEGVEAGRVGHKGHIWIDAAGVTGIPGHHYTFRTILDLTNIDPTTVRVEGQASATGALFLSVNGCPFKTTSAPEGGQGFLLENIPGAPAIFYDGVNTLDFSVKALKVTTDGVGVRNSLKVEFAKATGTVNYQKHLITPAHSKPKRLMTAITRVIAPIGRNYQDQAVAFDEDVKDPANCMVVAQIVSIAGKLGHPSPTLPTDSASAYKSSGPSHHFTTQILGFSDARTVLVRIWGFNAETPADQIASGPTKPAFMFPDDPATWPSDTGVVVVVSTDVS